MNGKNRFGAIHDQFRMPYTDQNIHQVMGEKIVSWLPDIPREYVVVCIGTDRSTGDALGPLTGTFLEDMRLKHLSVYGTLHDPVHATNLQEKLDLIYERHRRPFIIAIDACLGKNSSIGYVIAAKGPLKPGAALNKTLPEIGDLHITGVVNISGFMEYSVLQNTRLSIVMDMAKKIGFIIENIYRSLTYSYSIASVVNKDNLQRKRTI